MPYSGQSKLKQVLPETGGKNPGIIFADCEELDAAVDNPRAGTGRAVTVAMGADGSGYGRMGRNDPLHRSVAAKKGLTGRGAGPFAARIFRSG